jgi:hypothetical protein
VNSISPNEPVMSNYLHQQLGEISKKSLMAMFKNRNSKNDDILQERMNVFRRQQGIF